MARRAFSWKAHIKGLKEQQEQAERIMRDMQGPTMIGAVARGLLAMERTAKKAAPVDRGGLRASITPDIRQRANVIEGAIGSNRKYAPAQEGGTKPFWPPWAPIFQWARRKLKGDEKRARGLAYVVRRRIAQRGIKAKHYLKKAFEENEERIHRWLERAVNQVWR
jgi:hypothetical protein